MGLDDAKVEEICAAITDEIVVAANYNYYWSNWSFPVP